MAITRSSSTPSLVQKKSSKMGFKSLPNRNKGKRPVVEEDDSNFAPTLSKRERAPLKKKSKVAAQEKIPQDNAQKNYQDGVGLRSQVLPDSNPSVAVEKAPAIASDEEVDDTVTYTPLLNKRKRASTLKSPFVDFRSADVSSTPMEVMSSDSQSRGDERDFKMVTYVKGLHALNDTFADPVSPEIEAKFDAWIGK
ncbi:hypothetical protein CsatB_027052 [Cannabis sativa]